MQIDLFIEELEEAQDESLEYIIFCYEDMMENM